ncbi:MAG: PAS-domain containing protein [Pseudomonadota bacterium]
MAAVPPVQIRELAGQRLLLPVIQAALDRIDQGFTVFDCDLRLLAWNRHFLELLDMPETLAFVGADFASFIRHNAMRGEYGPGDPDEQVASRIANARRFEAHCFERTRPGGTIIMVSGAPLPQGGFVTVYTDVTAQRERETSLQQRVIQRSDALRQSEERLKLIANEVPAGIAHLDEDLGILYANSRFAKAYGMSPDEMIGRRCTEILADSTYRQAAPYFEEARRGSAVDFEMTINLPDGRRKDIRTFLRPERPSRGAVIGFYILSIDVTRTKAANAAVMQSKKMDALGRLSSGISHDFNNLLTIIMGNLLPLQDKVSDETLRADYIDPAIAAARRGSGLTQRLLTLARGEPVAPQAVDVDETIAGLVRILRASVDERVEIICSSRGRASPAYVDPAHFEMALLNLAMNASDAIRGAGEIRFGTDVATIGSVEAETLKIRRGRYVRVRVTDTGIGMSREQRDHVFEPFYTSKGEGVGAGLGLTMVYAFARQANGAVRIDSELGRGSAFTLLLPAAEEFAEQGIVCSAVLKPKGKDVESRGITLLVEDDPDVRRVMQRQLTGLGYAVIEAETVADALMLLDQVEGINLVLSDIGLPGGRTGIDLAFEIQKSHPSVGIVLMTGHAVSEPSPATERDLPILRKPIEPDALAVALSRQQYGRTIAKHVAIR